jgi:hypothetical protein
MPSYRIHRLKENQRQSFRWAPHTSGATDVRPRDYAEDGSVEAPGIYAAWALLRDGEYALKVGDLLETGEGGLHICKYVGFEEARWVLPEAKPECHAQPAAVVSTDGEPTEAGRQ